MATRLTMLCTGATASSRIGAFPSPDEPLDDGGARKVRAFRPIGRLPDLAVSSPCRAAIETLGLLGHQAQPEPLLADLDYGDWSGCLLAAVQETEPDRLTAWLSDPTQPTPGGEAPSALVARAGSWIDLYAGRANAIAAVCPAAVIRAALSHALAMPLAAAMRIDIAPLTTMVLSYHGQWRLQELRRPINHVDHASAPKA